MHIESVQISPLGLPDWCGFPHGFVPIYPPVNVDWGSRTEGAARTVGQAVAGQSRGRSRKHLETVGNQAVSMATTSCHMVTPAIYN